jgi:hypothetical protein
MGVEIEPVYIFECEFEDGGEWYHLRVDMIFSQKLFYRMLDQQHSQKLILYKW